MKAACSHQRVGDVVNNTAGCAGNAGKDSLGAVGLFRLTCDLAVWHLRKGTEGSRGPGGWFIVTV
jgi:hypothetical protein